MKISQRSINPIAYPIPWALDTLWRTEDEGGDAYVVQVFKNARCPCGTIPGDPTDSSNTNCKLCGGLGYFYPLPPLKVIALVSDVNQHRELMESGMFEYGDLVMSPRPGDAHLDDWDMVIVPWHIGIPTISEIITRNRTGNTDMSSYDMQVVDGAWQTYAYTGKFTSYIPNTDFTFSGKTITWISSNMPAPDTKYSIKYNGTFEWVAFNPPRPRLAFGLDLGQRVVLRRRSIVLDNLANLDKGILES